MGHDELALHLGKLDYDNCYVVDKVLKEGIFEKTQRVFYVGDDGLRQGPYVRKYITQESGLGQAYSYLYEAWKAGERFQHLPQVYNCYEMDDDLVVIMEYISGETLSDTVYRFDPSLELAIDLFPRICDGVIELHEKFVQPLIHRDLKPTNIMISHDRLLLIDFGITRSHKEGASQDTHHFGTKSYAPPEQFGFGQTDQRSDIYSLGMLLYYCLTEKDPKPRVRERGFADLEVPTQLCAVLAKATNLDPRHRHQSVRELKTAFLQAVGEAPQDKQHKQEVFPNYDQSVQVPQEVSPKKIKWSERIPHAPGVVWNVILSCMYAVLLAGAIGNTVDPSSDSAMAMLSVGMRAFQNFCVLFLILGPFYYLLFDKRRLKKRFSAFGKVTLAKEIIIALIVFTIGFLVIGFSD